MIYQPDYSHDSAHFILLLYILPRSRAYGRTFLGHRDYVRRDCLVLSGNVNTWYHYYCYCGSFTSIRQYRLVSYLTWNYFGWFCFTITKITSSLIVTKHSQIPLFFLNKWRPPSWLTNLQLSVKLPGAGYHFRTE